MIDLDAWARREKATLIFAERMALYRISQRYGWGLPHPLLGCMKRTAEQFRKLGGMLVEMFDLDTKQRLVAMAPRNGRTRAYAESIAFDALTQKETEQ